MTLPRIPATRHLAVAVLLILTVMLTGCMKINGDLTINGVTKPAALAVEYNGAATDPFGQKRVGFSASTEVSRKEFGLTWNAALETGGVLVGDKIRIAMEISAIAAA